MARQDNPFALLGDDDEGDDLSVLLAKVEAKIPALPPMVVEQPKQKAHDLPSKLPVSDYVREERGRGRGGRGRGPGRGGIGEVSGTDTIEQPSNGYYRGYNGEFGGGRSRGRGSRGGVGRGRGATGFGNRNHLDHENLGGLIEEGADNQDKAYYGESRPHRYGNRNFVEGKHGNDGEEAEHIGYMGYGDRENQGTRGYGADLENHGFRDGAGHEGRGYGGDREVRGSRDGEGHEGRRYGGDREIRGFRGGEGNEGRRYGGDRETRGFRDGESHEGRSYGTDRETRGFRDGENRDWRSYGGHRENRGFVDGEGHEGRSYGGDRETRGFRGGGGGRGRGSGARGRWGGRDGELGSAQYESNERWNAFETKDIATEEKEPIANNTNKENCDAGSVDPIASEEPKNGQLERPLPEQIPSEDAPKVPEEDNEMTLAEYEKLLQEKRKALDSLKMESRKVVADKDFEGMQIIEKKKEDELLKMKSDIDKGKKKETSERDEKSRKSLSINEFLKPADVERYRGPASSRGRGGGRGRGRGGYTNDYPSQAYSQAAASAPPLEDQSHFPVLRPAAKA